MAAHFIGGGNQSFRWKPPNIIGNMASKTNILTGINFFGVLF